MSATRKIQTFRSTGDNRQVEEHVDVSFPDQGVDTGFGIVAVLSEQFDHADFTDGGGAAGTIQFTGVVPKGAVLLGSKVTVEEGFAGDVSAALIIGDGDDTDRYNTSTVDVFTTAADGVESGVPSGSKLLTSANRPTLTVTVNADWGSVTAGKVTVSIYFIQT